MNQIDQNTFENQLGLGDYINIFTMHVKKIVFLIFFGTLLSTYQTYTTPPVYKATSTVIVRDKPGAAMVMKIGGKDESRIVNEKQFIKSRLVAKEVVKRFWNSDRRNRMHIFGTRRYYPKGERIRRIIKEMVTFGLYVPSNEHKVDIDVPYDDSIGEKYASKIIKNMSLRTQGNTDIIQITFSSVNADEAKRIANMISIVYSDLEKEVSSRNATSSVGFLNSLVLEQEKTLFNAEEDVKKFKIENKMYNLDSDANILTGQLSSIETELYNIQAEIRIRNEKINFINSKLTENEKTLARKISSDINVQMGVLRSEIISLESQLIQNASIHGKNHGAVIELKNKIDGLKIELDKKVKDLIDRGITVQDPLVDRQENISMLLSIESEIFGLRLREEETRKLQEIYSVKLSELPEKQLEFSRLKRNESVLNQNYSYIRQKLEEAKIQVASQGGRVQILDLARRPASPVSPNHRRDIIIGIFFSLLASLAVISVIEFLDNSVRSAADIKRYNLTILGIIPSIGKNLENNKKGGFFKRDRNRPKSKDMKRRLITREDPKSPISEAYRSLRTSLLYTDIVKETKSILVSSAGPGEGKTTTVANMAITYANLGKRTLLIDTDLRRPVVHQVLELQKEPGITNYLAKETKNFEDLIQKTEIENLYVVTSGIIPPNPSELLGSNKMADLIKQLEEEWDIVLFDSPPLVAVTDATMISKEIDKIIMVVKVGQTDKKALEHTINSLENVGSPLGGVVMNAVTQKNSYGTYYYYYQYYNYYGSDKQ